LHISIFRMKKGIVIFFVSVICFWEANAQNNSQIDSLLNLYHKNERTTRTLLVLGSLFLDSNADSAYFFSRQAYESAKKAKDIKSMAEAVFYSGYAKYNLQRPDSSLVFFYEADSLFGTLKDTFGIVKSIEKIGSVYYSQANYTKAAEVFMEELKLGEESSNLEVQASALNNLALIYQSDNDLETALLQYQRAYELFGKLKHTRGEALSLVNIGEVYKMQNKFSEAINIYQAAEKLCIEHQIKEILPYCRTNIGEVLLRLGDFEAAKKHVESAISGFSEQKNNIGLAESYNNLGEIALKTKQFAESVRYFEKSNEFAHQSAYASILKDNYNLLAESFASSGNFERAYQYRKRASELQDSLSAFKNAQIINQLKLNYESEKKDRKIELQEITIEKQANRLILLLVIVILATIFTVVIFILNRTKTLAFKKLVKKNLEIIKSEQELKETQKQLNLLVSENNKHHDLTPLESAEIVAEVVELEDIVNSPDEHKEERRQIIPEAEKELFLKEMERLIHEQKIFLQKDISINKIAELLQTNSLYTSHLINTHFGMNFNNVINSFRIKEAEKLLISEDYINYSIEGIGQTVGFNSKSSFNNAFKKFTGVTPSFYRKQANFPDEE